MLQFDSVFFFRFLVRFAETRRRAATSCFFSEELTDPGFAERVSPRLAPNYGALCMFEFLLALM